MRRLLKILGWTLAVVVLLVGAGGVALMLIPQETLVAKLADRVRAETGRELVIAGQVSPSIWPVIGVTTGAVSLSNVPGAEAEKMLAADGIEVGVELWPAISGEIRITSLRLIRPVVNLEIDAEGRPNWALGTAAPREAGHGGGPGEGAGDDLPRIHLPKAELVEATLRFLDRRDGRRLTVEKLDLTASLDGMASPLTAHGTGLWNGEAVALDLDLASPAALAAGDLARLSLSLDSERATLAVKGDIRLPKDGLPQIAARISLGSGDPATALRWAAGEELAEGLRPLTGVSIGADVKLAPEGLTLAADLAASWQARRVSGRLTAEAGAGWATAPAPAATLGLTATSEGLFRIALSGPARGGETPGFAGPVEIAIDDTEALATWLGAPLAGPAPVRNVSLRTDLDLTPARVLMEKIVLGLDGQPVTGRIAMTTDGPRPRIEADLTAGDLDFSALTAGERDPVTAPPSSAVAGATGWSRDPLDLSALSAAEAEIRLASAKLALGRIRVESSRLAITLADGRLAAKIAGMAVNGGSLTGTAVLTGNGGAGIDLALDARDLQLQTLGPVIGKATSLEGTGRLQLALAGRGASMQDLMSSLAGTASLALENGAVVGVNLTDMVRNLVGEASGPAERTDFSAITASFAVDGGVATTEDLTILGPLVRIGGTGSVDIGGQSVDMVLSATAVASIKGQGGSIADRGLALAPVKVTGPWSAISIRPDPGGAIEAIARDPAKALESVTGAARGAGALIGGNVGGNVGGILKGLTGGTPPPDATTAPAEGETAPPAPDAATGLRNLLGGTRLPGLGD